METDFCTGSGLKSRQPRKNGILREDGLNIDGRNGANRNACAEKARRCVEA